MTSRTFVLGLFAIDFSSYLFNPNIVVSWTSGGIQKVAWQTIPQLPFLRVANGTIAKPPIVNGNFQLEEHIDIDSLTSIATIENFHSAENVVSFQGQLRGSSSYSYSFEFFKLLDSMDQLGFSCNITNTDGTDATDVNRIYLTYQSASDEQFFGFGESFSFVNLKGRRVPILVSEQGVGRDLQPISDYLNENVAEGVGGHW